MTLRELLEDHGVSPEDLLDQRVGGVPRTGEPWIGLKITEVGVEIKITAPPVPYEGKETQ